MVSRPPAVRLICDQGSLLTIPRCWTDSLKSVGRELAAIWLRFGSACGCRPAGRVIYSGKSNSDNGRRREFCSSRNPGLGNLICASRFVVLPKRAEPGIYCGTMAMRGRGHCPSSKSLGRLSLFCNGGSGSPWIDVRPLFADGSSGVSGSSVF